METHVLNVGALLSSWLSDCDALDEYAYLAANSANRPVDESALVELKAGVQASEWRTHLWCATLQTTLMEYFAVVDEVRLELPFAVDGSSTAEAFEALRNAEEKMQSRQKRKDYVLLMTHFEVSVFGDRLRRFNAEVGASFHRLRATCRSSLNAVVAASDKLEAQRKHLSDVVSAGARKKQAIARFEEARLHLEMAKRYEQ